MTRYRWDGDRFINRATGEPMETVERVCLPSIVKDVSYVSPLSLRPITSRSERREEMKRHNVREVDPSEYKPTYRKKANAVRNRGEWNPDAGKPVHVDSKHYQRLSRADLPKHIARTVA